MTMITYSEKISLSPDLIKDIADSDHPYQQLEAILLASNVLYTLMLDYEYGKGNLHNVKLIENSLVMSSETTGTVNVSYDISEFSVCSALDYTGAYTMRLDFKLDLKSGEVILTGEERYE